MTRSRRGRTAAIAGLGGTVCLIVGLIPVLFLDWARRGGSVGKLSSLGLLLMAVFVAAIAVSAAVILFRSAIADEASPVDLWVVAFLALSLWYLGVLTLVPGLVFLRLTDDISLNDYGARFFIEWALVYVLVAAAALGLGRWSLRSVANETRSPALEPLK